MKCFLQFTVLRPFWVTCCFFLNYITNDWIICAVPYKKGYWYQRFGKTKCSSETPSLALHYTCRRENKEPLLINEATFQTELNDTKNSQKCLSFLENLRQKSLVGIKQLWLFMSRFHKNCRSFFGCSHSQLWRRATSFVSPKFTQHRVILGFCKFGPR